MSVNVSYPLNEPQQRRLTVSLAGLERLLAELRAQLEHGPADLRLTRFEDRLARGEAVALLAAVAAAETRLRRIADDLQLEALTDSVRRRLAAGLELAAINLHECRPGGGLKGCGAVASATADYLEREIPGLEAAVRAVSVRLAKAGAPEEASQHG